MPRKRRSQRKRKKIRSLIDGLKYYKKEATEIMDSILLDSLDKSDYDSFNEYKEDMESFNFSDIFN